MVPSVTKNAVMTALGNFIASVVPSGVSVVQGEINRTPEPTGADFVVMTWLSSVRLGTNLVTYADGYPANPSQATYLFPEQATVQVDVHGPNSTDNVALLTMLFWGQFSADSFAGTGYDVAPLYASEARQMPFINGENQVEMRSTFDAVMQANPTVSTAQQFAATLTPATIEIESTYAP